MIDLLFPTAVYRASNYECLEPCRQLFSKCTTLDSVNSYSENTTGFRTTLKSYNHKKSLVSWDVQEHEESKPLLDLIHFSVGEYAEWLKLKPHDVYIDGIWMNTMDNTAVHPVHEHYGHTFSGTYYVDVPKGAGNIKFYHQMSHTGHVELSTFEYNTSNTKTWWLPTEEGTIILFPAYFKHGVDKANFEGLRRSISFDVSLVPILD